MPYLGMIWHRLQLAEISRTDGHKHAPDSYRRPMLPDEAELLLAGLVGCGGGRVSLTGKPVWELSLVVTVALEFQVGE